VSRGRLVIISSSGLVAAGVAAALGALALDPARAAVGPLSPAAMILPADTTFLVGVDVQRFAASPLHRKFESVRFEDLNELEKKTGLRPDRDLDSVVIGGNKAKAGITLASGRFDRTKIAHSIETEPPGVAWRDVAGTTLYTFVDAGHAAGALALLDDRTLVVGSETSVEQTVRNHAKGASALRSNAPLMELVARVKPGSTFWMVGDQSLLENLPRTIPGGGDAHSLNLPALRSLIVTGDLDPAVSFQATGEALDEASAKNLGDIVRGMLALVAMQGKPELQQLISAITVTNEAARVHLSAQIPYAVLEALKPPAPAK
jgi:hypothetical protein